MVKITLKRGLDINIIGEIASSTINNVSPASCAIIPDDYPGFIPKTEVKEGDTVSAGSPILHDKNHPSVKITSPIGGRIDAIVRGERRKIEKIIITNDNSDSSAKIDTSDIKEALMQSGLWVMMRQRPYDIVPNPDKTPRDIFVTAFDSAPLAPDFDILLKGKEDEITAGLKALATLTDGKVYVGMRSERALCNDPKVESVIIKGPHPAGNAGIQAANIRPVNKGETVWTLDLITAARIGVLMLTGSVPYETIIAVTGAEVKAPQYVKTVLGAPIAPLLEGNLASNRHNQRIISGNVLTGYKTNLDGYIRYPYRQITVIPEGDDVDEFMGWASLSPKKMSVSRSFIGHFLRRKRFNPDARILGGRRAMIMSGEYDKVLPMDIMAEFLFKAILSRNIENMEALGIYEIAPEDVALCEYADTSKLELQKIVREGLDYLRKEIE